MEITGRWLVPGSSESIDTLHVLAVDRNVDGEELGLDGGQRRGMRFSPIPKY